jgi:hypothetical protein
MTQKLTVLAPVVNIRRGPNDSGAFIKKAAVGEQFDVLQLIPGQRPPEQWAKIILPDKRDVAAYICVTLPSGNPLCDVSAAQERSYADGFKAGVEHVLRWVSTERAKLGD